MNYAHNHREALLTQLTPRSLLLVFFLFLAYPWLSAHDSYGHELIHDLNERYKLYSLSQGDLEGFTQKISGTDYNYPSFREDLRAALIARANTGKMAIELLSGVVPADYAREEVVFFYYSDIDLNKRQAFDVLVNDQPLLTFMAEPDGSLRLLANPGKGNAAYTLVKRDNNNDGMGVFRLTIPASLLEKGKAARIKVQGQKQESTSWFMLFKAPDALSFLRKAAGSDAVFLLRQTKGRLWIDAPGHFAGKEVYVIADGVKSPSFRFEQQGEIATTSLIAKAPQKHFSLYCEGERFEMHFPKGDGQVRSTDIEGLFLLYQHSTIHGDEWQATLTRYYRPSFFETFTPFFAQQHEDGLVGLMNSSHQDIAWMDNPQQCIIDRDTMLITPMLQDAFVRNDYSFDIEDGLMLREYLERHPESQAALTELLKQKRLSTGASYNCPYEDMYDAEDQVRQLYLGKKWIKKTFGGYDAKVYWNVDVPGKSLQTPQILKKAGVDYMVISRHAKGYYFWQSPDGSQVFTYSPGHYGDDYVYLQRAMEEKIKYASSQVLHWKPYFQDGKNHTPLLSDQDMLPAIDYSDLLDTWAQFKEVKDTAGQSREVYFPKMDLMTAEEFLPLAAAHVRSVDTLKGERPNVWVYIHGPGHHEALSASREASKLLPAAEKFLSIAYLLDPYRMPYPVEELDQAWQAKIYPDHGWGGHDGDITDDLFKEKLVLSRSMGQELLDRATAFISRRVNTQKDLGMPLMVFNSLSWDRTDPASVSISLPAGAAQSLQLLTANGSAVPTQLADLHLHPDGSIQKATLHFLAEDIPAIGYKTFYVKMSSQPRPALPERGNPKTAENEYYVLTFEKGGIAQIYDKELKRNLLKTDHLMGADVFTMQSVGNGAGEFGDIQQPTMEDFDRVGAHQGEWQIVEQGEVFSRYRLRQPIRHAIVEQDVLLYQGVKQLQFETRLLNWSGHLYREFRTAFPLNMEHAEVMHEVPFGTVTVGQSEITTAGERYTPLCKDVHPRGIADWIAASDDSITVTLSSSVAAADWIDPTQEQTPYPVLQHLLLASRVSCHWEGNEYTQAGNHTFHYRLTSNKKGDLTGYRYAKQENEALKVVFNPDKFTASQLPETQSFFAIDQDNVIITALKKAEDNDNLIIRMYDAEGREARPELRSFFNIQKINHTNIIEEYATEVSAMKVGKFAIETFEIVVEK